MCAYVCAQQTHLRQHVPGVACKVAPQCEVNGLVAGVTKGDGALGCDAAILAREWQGFCAL